VLPAFYAAPEVCSHPPKFDDACDLWSMGVVTFVMLFGYPPFHDESDARILALVRKGFQPVVKPGWGAHFPAALPVSRAAMDFVARLMQTDIAKRMTAEEALSHRTYAQCSAALPAPFPPLCDPPPVLSLVLQRG
jgi:calcium-dependent protein kinase